MVFLGEIVAFLDQFAPSRLAEDWDNVGLLVGDSGATVDRVMTCLTITPSSAAEAVEHGARLIVSHHPLPFSPLKRITDETTVGRLLLQLVRAGVAIASPHTAFDSAARGINQALAEGLGLTEIAPLIAHSEGEGTGRFGCFSRAITLDALAQAAMRFLKCSSVHVVGPPNQQICRVAVGCGAAGELLASAVQRRCEAMLLGEARFHTCLEAEAQGVGLVLAGHFATERFAVERLATVLAEQFPTLEVWPSSAERDPLRLVVASPVS